MELETEVPAAHSSVFPMMHAYPLMSNLRISCGYPSDGASVLPTGKGKAFLLLFTFVFIIEKNVQSSNFMRYIYWLSKEMAQKCFSPFSGTNK